MKNLSLTSAMSSNLPALKQTSSAMAEVQNRLATGLKVNSALDNPSAYYTAVSLNNRASDLNSLLDNMGQAIQTVKASMEGIETGMDLLEQMRAVAERAMSEPQENIVTNGGSSSSAGGVGGALPELSTKNIDDYIDEGYTAITAAMSYDEVVGLMSVEGAKLVLAEDLSFNAPLMIQASNVTLNGNGHKITSTDDGNGFALATMGGNTSIRNLEIEFHSDNEYLSAVIVSTSEGATADISNVRLSNDNAEGYGVVAADYGQVTIDSVAGIEAKQKVAGQVALSALYNGKANTQAIINQIGAAGLAASAVNQFYVGSKTDANFGQGKWYLPAIGELADVYGTDPEAVGEGYGTAGATGENKVLINAALSTLKGKGVEAETLTNSYYLSSSESGSDGSWGLIMNDGTRGNYDKDSTSGYVRSFQLLENCFNPLTLSDGSAGGSGSGAAAPKIGDVMYSDLSYGSANDYDGSKTAVGVVTWVSEDGKSAKIMNLKDLTFSSYNSENNFDPDNPYGGRYRYTYWSTGDRMYENINDIPDFMGGKITIGGSAYVPGDNTAVDANNGTETAFGVSSQWSAEYNAILNQYDMLINDASYKGINLLKGDALNVIFNENKSSRLFIQGHDVTSSALGIHFAAWETTDDVSASVSDLRRAINTLRSLSGEFGNNYSIVQNRQDFTENLINILTEGADKLTLADMNEESANMLALQTSQQLAINSLSLASQASQSILRLFA